MRRKRRALGVKERRPPLDEEQKRRREKFRKGYARDRDKILRALANQRRRAGIPEKPKLTPDERLERSLEAGRRYRERHPDWVRNHKRKYYDANRERLREEHREYARRSRRMAGIPERPEPTPEEARAKQKAYRRQWEQTTGRAKAQAKWQRYYAKHRDKVRDRWCKQSQQRSDAILFLRTIGVIKRGDGGSGRSGALRRAALAYLRQLGIMP
jgi:hypothetical protein